MTRSICPMCGDAFDDEKDAIYECPECGSAGSSACCMPGGRGVPCVDCEGGDDDDESD